MNHASRVRRGARHAVGGAVGFAFEALEGRQLLSVAQDAGGWTVVTPSADSRVVYVSSSGGNDSNTGLSPSSPVRTIAKGESLLRNNSPDELLLKRGDVFHETLGQWALSGRSQQEPMLIGAYGTGGRPVLATGSSNGLVTGTTSHPEVDHLYVIGLSFVADARDPANASSPGFSPGSTPTGISFNADGTDLLVEDCQVRYYTTNLNVWNYFGNTHDLTVRRCQILDAYSTTGAHAEGLYSNGGRGLTLEGNVFDHNGWNESISGAVPTIYNHDIYLSNDNTDVVVRGNVISRAGSHGLQARSGGIIQGNLFVDDALAMSFGLVNGSPMTAGGASGDVSGNVILGGANIGSLVRGAGIEIGNIAAGSHTAIHDNLFANGLSTGLAAMELEVGQGVTNPQDAVGINDLTISGNVVYNWAQGISEMPNLQPGVTGLSGLNNLTVQGNAFQGITGSHIIQHMEAMDVSQEHFAGNVYDAGAAQSAWFNIQSNWTSLSAWTAKVESDASARKIAYLDPTRTLASYNAGLGGGASTAAFLAGARGLSSQNWQPQYTAAAADSYLLAGFGMASASAPPAPTPAVVSASVNDGLGGTAGGNATQRSQVRQLVVTFNEPVNLSWGAFGLSLLNSGGSGSNDGSAPTDVSGVLGTPANPNGDGATWVIPVLANTAYSDAVGGLKDGVYALTVNAAGVAAAGGAGGVTMAAGNYSLTFHRLFGDSDGSGTVNALDLARSKQAYGSSVGGAGYNADLDYDNNGTISALDYVQFRRRFGVTFTY